MASCCGAMPIRRMVSRSAPGAPLNRRCGLGGGRERLELPYDCADHTRQTEYYATTRNATRSSGTRSVYSVTRLVESAVVPHLGHSTETLRFRTTKLCSSWPLPHNTTWPPGNFPSILTKYLPVFLRVFGVEKTLTRHKYLSIILSLIIIVKISGELSKAQKRNPAGHDFGDDQPSSMSTRFMGVNPPSAQARSRLPSLGGQVGG